MSYPAGAHCSGVLQHHHAKLTSCEKLHPQLLLTTPPMITWGSKTTNLSTAAGTFWLCTLPLTPVISDWVSGLHNGSVPLWAHIPPNNLHTRAQCHLICHRLPTSDTTDPPNQEAKSDVEHSFGFQPIRGTRHTLGPRLFALHCDPAVGVFCGWRILPFADSVQEQIRGCGSQDPSRVVSARSPWDWHWLDCVGYVPAWRGGADMVQSETIDLA